ncbi:hypothetical protein GJAV_G00128840 [Gymnothorax javanicus]|nr:hypothetical protein GJAV_G00128840 [Gymnothorax javanicus]
MWAAMGKDSSNYFILSSKKATCHYRGEQGREIEKLRTALEAEKSKNRQAQRKLALELRRLRETVERERQKAEQDLTYRHEREKALELLRLREVLQKEQDAEVRKILRLKGEELRAVGSGLEKERESTRRQAWELQRQLFRSKFIPSCAVGRKDSGGPGCLDNVVTYQFLGQVLQQLGREANGEQAGLLQRLTEELELDKSFFVHHLLEAHNWAEPEVSGVSRRQSLSCTYLLSQNAKSNTDLTSGRKGVSRSRSLPHKLRSVSLVPRQNSKGAHSTSCCSSPVKEVSYSSTSSQSRSAQTSSTEEWESVHQHLVTESAVLDESSLSKCSLSDMESSSVRLFLVSVCFLTLLIWLMILRGPVFTTP